MSAGGVAELQARIAKHAWEDPAFEAEFMADPRATFEKYTGQALPAELQIHAHYNTPNELHFVLPKRVDSGELSDEDLERVAGGELTLSLLVTMISMSVLSASAISAIEGSKAGW